MKKIPKGFVIVINGSTGVGKTTIAWELAQKYQIVSIVGTDLIREVVRYDVERHNSEAGKIVMESSYSAHRAFEKLTGQIAQDRLIGAFERQCEYLLGPIIKILFRVRIKRNPLILEGINITATQLFGEIPNDPHNRLFFVNLYLESEDAHLKRIKQRAEQVGEMAAKTRRYIENFQSIRKIDRYLRNDTLKAIVDFGCTPENILSIENSKSLSKAISIISRILDKKIEAL
ncbi:MAG: hypothetical protein ACE5GL_09740 [Calditrichia bacterium]